MDNQMQGLLAQANPQLGRILDQEARQKAQQARMQGANYGNDAMGRFLSAYSGAARSATEGGRELANNVMGNQPAMGRNEQMAVQAQQAQQDEQAKNITLQKKLANADESQLRTIIQNNIVQNPTLAKAAQEVLKMKESVTETPSIGEGSTFIDDATGNSYTVFTDDKGKQTIKPVGGNATVAREEIKGNLVTPNVYQTLFNAKNDLKMLDAEERKDALTSQLSALSPASKAKYYKSANGLSKQGLSQEELDAKKLQVLNELGSAERLQQGKYAEQDFFQSIENIDSVVEDTVRLRKDMTAVGYATGKYIPGTDAYTLSQDITTLQSNSFLEKLMELKTSSQTGASGLGQVTEREIDLLIKAFRSIDPAMNQGDFEERIGEFRQRYAEIQEKIARAKGADVTIPTDDNNPSDLDETYNKVKAEYEAFKKGS